MSFSRAVRRILGPVKPVGDVPLHVCQACRRDFVHPTAWKDEAGRARRVYLRCGACGHAREAVVGPDGEKLLTRALDKRFGMIAEAADRLEQELMARWVDEFAGALRHDLIDASDFAD
jgi:hypothetical protein